MLIEYAMYFALGFLVAGLLMLMAMPAFWRRAMRLSMRRLQLLAPLSREDAIAERDLLRAEFAVKERQLEQRMEAVNADRAAVMLDIGRHAARISDLHDQLQAALAHGRELEQRLAEARTVLAERTELLAETERALREATEGAERDAEKQKELRAAHEARIGDLHQLNTDLRREYAQLGEEFSQLAAEAERLAGVEVEFARISADLAALKAGKLSLEHAYTALRQSSEHERERFIAEITHLENALRHTRAEARASADKLEALRSDHALLQGAAAALREDHEARRRDGAGVLAREPFDSHEVAALRRDIAEIGATLAAQAAREPQRDTASA